MGTWLQALQLLRSKCRTWKFVNLIKLTPFSVCPKVYIEFIFSNVSLATWAGHFYPVFLTSAPRRWFKTDGQWADHLHTVIDLSSLLHSSRTFTGQEECIGTNILYEVQFNTHHQKLSCFSSWGPFSLFKKHSWTTYPDIAPTTTHRHLNKLEFKKSVF